jgi:hypothetical protein
MNMVLFNNLRQQISTAPPDVQPRRCSHGAVPPCCCGGNDLGAPRHSEAATKRFCGCCSHGAVSPCCCGGNDLGAPRHSQAATKRFCGCCSHGAVSPCCCGGNDLGAPRHSEAATTRSRSVGVTALFRRACEVAAKPLVKWNSNDLSLVRPGIRYVAQFCSHWVHTDIFPFV